MIKDNIYNNIVTRFNTEIYTNNSDEATYQYNDSPHLTQDFIDFLEEIDIDIYNSIYKVTKL